MRRRDGGGARGGAAERPPSWNYESECLAGARRCILSSGGRTRLNRLGETARLPSLPSWVRFKLVCPDLMARWAGEGVRPGRKD